MSFTIPGRSPLTLKRLVLDYNGTIATDGSILPGVIFRLEQLASQIDVVVLTADTHNSAATNLAWTGLARKGVELIRIPAGHETEAKLNEVTSNSPESTYAIGNGVNDQSMLSAAALSTAIVGNEGAAREAVQAAMIVVRDIEDALDLILMPKRLIATLRR